MALNVALYFCFYVCRFLIFFLLNVFLKVINIFAFFGFNLVEAFAFIVKSFYCHGKMFCERKVSCTRLDLSEILLREQNGQS